jgi:STE24 endopeptidase
MSEAGSVITAIILLTLAVDYILHGIADFLNLKNLRAGLPEMFKGVYDADRYAKSQKYLRENTRFEWISSSFGLLVLLLFWFSHGFFYLDQWVRSVSQHPIVAGLIYMASLLLAKFVLSLPFSIYATFVIEARYGFNKTTWQTFFLDSIKAMILVAILGGPVMAGVLAFFEYAGQSAWLYCWVAVAGFILGMQYLFPTWIMPLFNKFDPIADGDLKTAIMAYACSIHFPLDNVFVMDGSKRSSKANAFFTGFGRKKRIVLYDTLISQHTVAELVAILAHEMGHFKKNHIVINLAIAIAQMGLLFYLLSVFISSQALFDAFFMREKSVYAGFIFFGILYAPLDFLLGLFINELSRKHEYAADRFAVETTGNSQGLANALKKLSVQNLSNLSPHSFYVLLNYSHPPVVNRIKAMNRLLPKLNTF